MPNEERATFLEHVENRACFVAGTKVTTKRGVIPIEQVKKGDQVLSYHPSTGVTGYRAVLTTGKRTSSALVDVTINGEKIRATREHPFLVGSSWIEAAQLAPGMLVQVANGSGAKPVQAVAKVAGSATVHNLTIDGWEVYTVGAGAYVVHNNCVVGNASFDPGKGTIKVEIKGTCGATTEKVKLGQTVQTLKVEPQFVGSVTVTHSLKTGKTTFDVTSNEIKVGMKVEGNVTISGQKATIEVNNSMSYDQVTARVSALSEVAAQTKLKFANTEIVTTGVSIGTGVTVDTGLGGIGSKPFGVESANVRFGGTLLGVTGTTIWSTKDGLYSTLAMKAKLAGNELGMDLTAWRDKVIMKTLDAIMTEPAVSSSTQVPRSAGTTWYPSASDGYGRPVVSSDPWSMYGNGSYYMGPSSGNGGWTTYGTSSGE